MTGPVPERSPGADRASWEDGASCAAGPAPLTYDALVLAGGRARRLGGVSKPDVVVSGRRLLAHVLDAATAGDGARRTVVVAPDSVAVAAGVLRTLEDPPDGGPVAGIAAGLAALGRAGDEPAPWVLVLACDVPRAAVAVPHLVAACAGGTVSGAVLVDAGGRDQPLVGLYRRADLDRALATLATGRDDGTVRGASVRALLTPLTLARVPDDGSAAADVDTWEDVRALDGLALPGAGVVARPGTRAAPQRWDDGDGPTAAAAPVAGDPQHPRAARPARPARPVTRSTRPPEVPVTASDDTGETAPATPLDAWVRALSAELGVDPEVVDVAGLLDVARDAAHGVARPATPLTTFLLGYAVASGTVGLDEAMRRTSALAAGWQERAGAPGGTEA